MLFTLFSPAEGKLTGGLAQPMHDLLFDLSSRDKILHEYSMIVTSGDTTEIATLFGIKKASDIKPYITDLRTAPVMPAIERYNGVAYEYLDYKGLTDKEQDYLKRQTIIFSNLYGPLMGGDLIANYKVKQGNHVGSIAPDKFYKEAFTSQLDALLQEHDILDLRAAHYDKFYKVTRSYTTLKFIKNGRVVSHWAKAYRGIVLRYLAQNDITSLDAFMAMDIEGLTVKEIKRIKAKTEVVFDIV